MSTIAPVISYKFCKAYLPHLFHIKWKMDLLAKEADFVMFSIQGILNIQLAAV